MIVSNELAVSRIRRVTAVGLILNLMLTAAKFAAGILGASQALVADAVHSLSDSFTDITVMVGAPFWLKPPDACHPYGHRRIETLVTISIGFVLLAAAVGIAWEAIEAIRSGGTRPPAFVALVTALFSLGSKEWLFHWTVKVGRRLKSPAVVANAWHHRLDALSSIPAALAIAAAMLAPSLAFIDEVGAVVVAVFILHAGIKIIWPGISEVAEEGAPEEVVAAIRSIAESHVNVMDVHAIRSRRISGSLHVDLHLVIDGDISVRAGHAIAESVRQRLLSDGPEVVDVVVHVEPPEAAMQADRNQAGESRK
jgi:cation diffusion facilitator family transporter